MRKCTAFLTLLRRGDPWVGGKAVTGPFHLGAPRTRVDDTRQTLRLGRGRCLSAIAMRKPRIPELIACSANSQERPSSTPTFRSPRALGNDSTLLGLRYGFSTIDRSTVVRISASAKRTPSWAQGPGSNADRRLPNVILVFAALPPHPTVRPPGDIFGRHFSVHRRMPLTSNVRSPDCKRVRWGRPRPRTVGTPVSPTHTSVHRVLPFVAIPASPPHSLMRPARDVAGRKCSVLRRMPLSRNVRGYCQQAVGSSNPLAGAEGATGRTACSYGDSQLPNVVLCLRTFPPHKPPGPGEDTVGAQLAVSRRVPLGREVGAQCLKRVCHR